MNVKPLIHIICILLVTLVSSMTIAADAPPKLFAYWVGSGDLASPGPTIPDIPFAPRDVGIDGLFLSFAILKKDSNGNYSTSYTASGNFQNWGTPAHCNWHGCKNDPTEETIAWLTKIDPQFPKDITKRNWDYGARAYLSYGGATNLMLRTWITEAGDEELKRIAKEIKKNISDNWFDGVDLDIEHWWEDREKRWPTPDNIKFANNLAKLVIYLREMLDENPKDDSAFGKPIMICVGKTSANDNDGSKDSYVGSMKPFFANKKTMDSIAFVNIMAYNAYSDEIFRDPNLTELKELLQQYVKTITISGLSEQSAKSKLIIGYQPYESNRESGYSSPIHACKLGRYIKDDNYGGIFFFGLGSGPGKVPDLTPKQETDYIVNLRKGLRMKDNC